jgi:hypothetical protein
MVAAALSKVINSEQRSVGALSSPQIALRASQEGTEPPCDCQWDVYSPHAAAVYDDMQGRPWFMLIGRAYGQEQIMAAEPNRMKFIADSL